MAIINTASRVSFCLLLIGRGGKKSRRLGLNRVKPSLPSSVPRSSRFDQSWTSSGVCQFWKKRKQWSTSPTITWSPWRWSFSKHTKWRTRERRRKSIDQNSRLFLFYRAFYLPFYLSRYYELGSSLRTGSNHSCAIVLRSSRA